MSDRYGQSTRAANRQPSQNVSRIVGMGTALVALNIVLMFLLSYTAAAEIGATLFSNFFLGIAVFVGTVGGGFWLGSRGIERGSYSMAGAGVALTQAGYGLFGATVLGYAPPELRIPALGVTTIVTAAITAAIVLVVFKTNRSFAGWQRYAGGLFIGGIAVGAIGFFAAPMLMVVAGLLFFLGFVVDLTYEIWAVRENRYASDLRNALGIYVAVMGVFVHVLQWVLRILSAVEN